MADKTMREKIARAIFEVNRPGRLWEKQHPYEQKQWFDNADAALAAMREPSEAMERAGHRNEGVRSRWYDMINAACNEGANDVD